MDEKNTELKIRRVFGKSYYSAEEVDSLWASMAEERGRCAEAVKRAEELEGAESRCEELEEQLQIARANIEKLKTDNKNLEERLARQKSMSVSEKTSMSEKIDSLRDELERSELREKYLNADMERKKTELEKYEKLMSTDAIALANEKAHKILADATAESERIFSEYTNQRARVAAATRAAYYNALQFKLSLTERFNMMERELDDTIDVLRVLDMPTSDTSPSIDAVALSGED